MTADSYEFPHEFLSRVATRLFSEVRGINRVAYDIVSTPLAAAVLQRHCSCSLRRTHGA
jgi:GMP synthase PP-ATPase subunit